MASESERLTQFEELREAVRAVLPYLQTSYDGPEMQPAINRATGAGLRMAAERADRRDAAIYRLRKEMADGD